MDRRDLLKTASVGAAYLAARTIAGPEGSRAMAQTVERDARPAAYECRIAFGAWINDLRNSALPLQQWPAPQFDEQTVEGAVRTLEVTGESGYQYLDAFGLYATGDYPPDIVSAFEDRERNRRLERIFRVAGKHDIRMSLPLGLLTWGYDRIIREDPEVRGKDQDGNPHAHAMCGAREKSWTYIEKLIDTMFDRHDFGAVHLESADLGYCMCPECTGRYGVVGYNARLNMRAADYIKGKYPEALVYVCPINWLPWGLNDRGVQHKFSGDDADRVIELSKHIDVFMDQGHRGRLLEWEAVPDLQCAYGTSGGLWVYHGCRHDRLSYALPYPRRAAEHLRDHHQRGARGCLYYQGPMINPAVELNAAVAGRVMGDVSRDPREVLEEVIERYYQPRGAEAGGRLADVYLAVEEAYFGQWDEARFKEQHKLEMPGEFTVGVLFNTSPDPATYLLEPFLGTEGRVACKTGLKAALNDLMGIAGDFDDHGRIERLTRCLITMLHTLTTIMLVKEEAWAD